MGMKNQVELNLLVEDEVAKSILSAILPAAIRARTQISVIGSATAIARQMAAQYVRGETSSIVAIFDGDQRDKASDNLKHAKGMAEKVGEDFDGWWSSCTAYLPGNTWPEAYIVQKCKQIPGEVSKALFLEGKEESEVLLESGLQAGKHNEFYEIGLGVGLDKDVCMTKLVDAFSKSFYAELDYLVTFCKEKLDG